MSRGTIVASYAVFCASLNPNTCRSWTGEQTNTRKGARRIARDLHWRNTRKHGWLCLNCQVAATRNPS